MLFLLLLLPFFILFVLLVHLAFEVGAHIFCLVLDVFGEILKVLSDVLGALFELSSHPFGLPLNLLRVNVAFLAILIRFPVLRPLAIALSLLPILVLAAE